MGAWFIGKATAQVAGTTTTASTVSITASLPGGAQSGHRIFVFQAASGVAGTTPTNWTAVFKDQIIGTGAVAAGSGQRYLSCYYRDYDGLWSMPAFTLTSATQLSHAIATMAVGKPALSTWDTPTYSADAEYFGTAGTAYSATTGSSFTTHRGGFLMSPVVTNDNVTMTDFATAMSGGTSLNTQLLEQADGGTATGNDVSIKLFMVPVYPGVAGTITMTGTLSAASQGGNIWVEQTATPATVSSWAGPEVVECGPVLDIGSSTTASVPVPAGVTLNDIIVVELACLPDTRTVSAVPSGFTLKSTVVNTGNHVVRWYWKRQTSATGAGETTGTYDFTLGAGDNTAAVAHRIINCITTGDPFDAVDSATPTTNVTSTSDARSLTTTGTNRLILHGASHGGGQYRQPSGFTDQWEGSSVFANGLSSKQQAAAGGSGSVTCTFDFAYNNTAWLAALIPAAAGTTLTPAAVTLTLTGSAPRLDVALRPAAATLTLIGSAPRLDLALRPTAASLTLTSSAPRLDVALRPAATSLTLTGLTPTVTATAHQTLIPAAASLTVTVSTPAVITGANQILTPAAASLALTGAAPVVTPSDHKTLIPTGGTLTLTGSTTTVTVTANQTVTPASGGLTVTGSVPRLDSGIRPAGAALTITGAMPTVAASNHRTVTPAGISFGLSGAAATVTASNHQRVTPTAVTLAVTGAAPQLITGVRPAGASLTLTGSPPKLDSGIRAASTSFTLTSSTPVVAATAHRTITPATTVLTLTGALLDVLAGGSASPSPDDAVFALTGGTATVTATAHRTVTPGSASLALTGAAPTVTAPVTIRPAAATLALTGGVPSIAAGGSATLSPATVSLTLTGSFPTVLVGDEKIANPTTAALALTGGTPAVAATAHQAVTPTAAPLTLSGSAPQVLIPIYIIPPPTSLALICAVPGVVWLLAGPPPDDRTITAEIEARIIAAEVDDRAITAEVEPRTLIPLIESRTVTAVSEVRLVMAEST